jgi:hypothetical protein
VLYIVTSLGSLSLIGCVPTSPLRVGAIYHRERGEWGQNGAICVVLRVIAVKPKKTIKKSMKELSCVTLDDAWIYSQVEVARFIFWYFYSLNGVPKFTSFVNL